MTTNEYRLRLQNALAAGKKAYSLGKPCTPALDPTLSTLLAGLEIGDEAINILKTWQKGWVEASLSEPVE